MIQKFSKNAIDALGSYVYVYSDPDTKKPFYVGKGKGNRVFDHLNDNSESEKCLRIQELRSRGKEPLIEILVHGLDEETALKVEAAAIDLIGIENLTNVQRGHDSSIYGKIEVSLLDARYSHEKLFLDDIDDNVIIIRINKIYRNGMTSAELYDAVRGHWHLNLENARKTEYALAVYDGMVIEVYKIVDWYPANSTFMERTEHYYNKQLLTDRYEFVGRIADEDIRRKYKDKSVSNLFKKGESNPIKYILGKCSTEEHR